MDIFSYEDYRRYLKEYLSALPKKGRGELSKISKYLGVHSTLLSLILNGERDLSLEQGHDLAAYLQLTDLEADYLLLLIQYSRAGNPRFKEAVKKKMDRQKKLSAKISERFSHEKILSEEQRSVFYSSWLYSAVRLFTSIGNGASVEEIVSRFQLPRPQALNLLNFLIGAGLITEVEGRYQMAVQRTFLEQGSPHLPKHHTNWRLKAIQKSDFVSEQELMFSSPISISKDDFEKIREQILVLIKSVSKTVKDSPAEDVACLNIDLFWVK